MHTLSRAEVVTRGEYSGQVRLLIQTDLLFVSQHELIACVVEVIDKSLQQTATA